MMFLQAAWVTFFERKLDDLWPQEFFPTWLVMISSEPQDFQFLHTFEEIFLGAEWKKSIELLAFWYFLNVREDDWTACLTFQNFHVDLSYKFCVDLFLNHHIMSHAHGEKIPGWMGPTTKKSVGTKKSKIPEGDTSGKQELMKPQTGKWLD